MPSRKLSTATKRTHRVIPAIHAVRVIHISFLFHRPLLAAALRAGGTLNFQRANLPFEIFAASRAGSSGPKDIEILRGPGPPRAQAMEPNRDAAQVAVELAVDIAVELAVEIAVRGGRGFDAAQVDVARFLLHSCRTELLPVCVRWRKSAEFYVTQCNMILIP